MSSTTFPPTPRADARPPQVRVLRHCALYEGTVTHRRPGLHGHGFSQEVQMALVYLDDFEQFCDRHWLWSARHPAPVWLRRADYMGDPAVPLARSVADLVEAQSGARPRGRIALLSMPRVWGWSFNPISCYFCFDETGERVVATVLEVTNTPWHDRHCYVVGGPGLYHLGKELHVSPFLSMDLTYRLRFSDPGATFDMRFDVVGSEGTELFAGVRLHRVPADRRSMGRLVWRPGRGSLGVTAGIYRQALALWRKGATFHRRPSPHLGSKARTHD